MRSFSTIFFLSLLLATSCCKDEIEVSPTSDPFAELTEKNQLPYRLPTVNNQSAGDQTKELFFYNENSIDVVFRSIGVLDSNSFNTKLWVQVLNPDIRIFADSRVDTFYRDTVIVGGNQVVQVHNRDDGQHFFQLDTALLALPFDSSQLDSYRPNLFDQTVVTVHVMFNEKIPGTNIEYEVERGVLRRKLHDYMGFKNINDGRVFFVELKNRYLLNSIIVRQD